MMLLAVIVAWVGVGLIGSGFDYAYFRCKWPTLDHKRQQVGEALTVAIAGPIALVITFLITGCGQHGWWFFNKRDRAIRQTQRSA